MGYTGTERELTSFYRGEMSEGQIPGSGINISGEDFRSVVGYSMSDMRSAGSIFRSLFRSGELERVNNRFRYYLLSPSESTGKGAIILLHGLNERSWGKYIQWGMRLAGDTGRPVVLFPSAYHMNRSPKSWIDRHLMMPLVAERTSMMPDTRMTSFLNVALSTRMSVSPQRFTMSGYQTVSDLSSLIRMITGGFHPDIEGGGPVDIFAYSIGALATQVMMLSNPSPLPDDTRVMLFCGGSAFSLMDGTSKFIMDSKAFDRLLSFYLEWPEPAKVSGNKKIKKILDDTPEGRAFYTMTSLSRLKDNAGTPFSHMEGRFRAVSFAGDRVIPSDAVSATLTGADMETWNPDYPFTHENPFPVLLGEKAYAVDRMFDRLFTTAATFLA